MCFGETKTCKNCFPSTPYPLELAKYYSRDNVKMTEFYEGITLYDHGGYNEDYMKVVKKNKTGAKQY